MNNPQTTASGLPADDLFDLDDLLVESTNLATAHKAAKQGRKLTAAQADLLEANKQAEAMLVWDAKESIAHFVESTCACGHTHRRFNGWYRLLTHKWTNSIRLESVDCHGGLEASQHTTTESTAYCAECLATVGLPPADLEETPILSSLGDPAPENRAQLSLELLAGEASGDAMLAELGGEADADGNEDW
jgi:hypothetical protein